MNIPEKHIDFASHLMNFSIGTLPPSEEQIMEYMTYQSTGKKCFDHNPLLSCQQWKEFTITNIIEDCFESWCMNCGWATTLLHEIDSLQNPRYGETPDQIMIKALTKIKDGIEKVGMFDFYLSHPSTNHDKKRLKRMLEMKYGSNL